jgi:hypothetical protein
MSKLMWVLILQGLAAICALIPSLKPIEKTAGRILIALLTVIFLGVSGYLAVQIDKESTAAVQDAQRKAKEQWDQIQHNTENPPPVVVPPARVMPRRAAVALSRYNGCNSDDPKAGPETPNLQTFMIGHISCVNFYFHNTGSAPADHAKYASRIYFTTSETPEQILTKFEAYKKAKDAATPPSTISTATIPIWFTAESDELLTLEKWQGIANGTAKAYVIYAVDFRDPTGAHFLHHLQVLQRPAGQPSPPQDDKLVWQVLSQYTGEQ